MTPSGPLDMSGCSFFNAFWMMSGVISMCMIVGVTIVAYVFRSTLKMVSSLASFYPVVEKCSFRMSGFPRSDVTRTPSRFLSPGVVTGCFFNKLPIGFKVLDLVKQIRVV